MNQIPNLRQIVTAHDPHHRLGRIAVSISICILICLNTITSSFARDDKVENILAQRASAQPFLCYGAVVGDDA